MPKWSKKINKLSREEWTAQYEEVPIIVKDLWNVELDLLEKFDEICRKYGLKWFADGGTLLGAVRHQGFIPWDDDIDIIMPLKDYMIFCKLKDEFKWPYFLQTWETEDGFTPFLTKLRRSDTTGYNFREEGVLGWNKGISIDIFALVYIPENIVVEKLQLIILKGIRFLLHGYESLSDNNRQTTNSKILTTFVRGLYRILSPIMSYKVLSKLYIEIGCWQKKRTSRCGPVLFVPGKKEFKWPSKWYKKTEMLDFMERKVPCPYEWDKRLMKQYHDYQIPKKAPSKHGKLIFDPYHSYLEQKSSSKRGN